MTLFARSWRRSLLRRRRRNRHAEFPIADFRKSSIPEDLAKIDGFTYGDSDVNGGGQIRLAETAAAA